MAFKRCIAYIDAANLHHATIGAGWKLDYQRLLIWLHDRYHIEEAYMFMGFIPKFTPLYEHLRYCGFSIIFRDVIRDKEGNPKGNCDGDLIVKVMRDVYEYRCDECIIVSSDGDFASLIEFLMEKKKLQMLLSPAVESKCSILLKRTSARISYLNDQRSNLEKR